MLSLRYLQNVLIGTTAVAFAGAHFVPGADATGPVLTKAVSFVAPKPAATSSAAVAPTSSIAERRM